MQQLKYVQLISYLTKKYRQLTRIQLSRLTVMWTLVQSQQVASYTYEGAHIHAASVQLMMTSQHHKS